MSDTTTEVATPRPEAEIANPNHRLYSKSNPDSLNMASALAHDQAKHARCPTCHLIVAPSSLQSQSCTPDSPTKHKHNHTPGAVCCEGNFCPDLNLTELEEVYIQQQQQCRRRRHSLLNPNTEEAQGG